MTKAIPVPLVLKAKKTTKVILVHREKRAIKVTRVILAKMQSLMFLLSSITMMEQRFMSSITKRDRILSMMDLHLLESEKIPLEIL